MFLFKKGEINLKDFFWKFLENFSEETEYCNIIFVFYSVNIQPDIMQN